MVGGSIAGCGAALAAVRGGAGEVVVYERSRERLQDRGVGIAVLGPPFAALTRAGYLDPEIPCVEVGDRVWVVRDGTHPTGRVIWRQPFPARAFNWGLLWQWLRDRLPAAVAYRAGVGVTSVAADGTVLAGDGSRERFDVVAGADGYRSAVRSTLFPDHRPRYAGYAIFRGCYPQDRLPGGEPFWMGAEPEPTAVTAGYRGGHFVGYVIPAPGGAGRLVNWGAYMRLPDTAALAPEEVISLPPGTVPPDLAADLNARLAEDLPPYWAQVVMATEPSEISLQPVYDLALPAYAGGRVMLMGDAGAVLRPHTGSGVAKALQDAHTFESLCGAGPAETWPEVLACYSAERTEAGRRLVELGRRFGAAQVERTPDWSSMTEARMTEWWRAQQPIAAPLERPAEQAALPGDEAAG